jgi:hypothetical protein
MFYLNPVSQKNQSSPASQSQPQGLSAYRSKGSLLLSKGSLIVLGAIILICGCSKMGSVPDKEQTQLTAEEARAAIVGLLIRDHELPSIVEAVKTATLVTKGHQCEFARFSCNLSAATFRWKILENEKNGHFCLGRFTKDADGVWHATIVDEERYWTNSPE